MSGRYLVMPRGINVGTRNRVPMAELRSKLTEAGHSDPVTILQSGNVITTSDCADAPALASSMEQLLAEEFGVNVRCLARTAEQVEAVLERDPLGDVADDGSRYLVNFLSQEPDVEAVRSLREASHEPEVVHVEGSEVYVWTPEGVKAMRLSYSYWLCASGSHGATNPDRMDLKNQSDSKWTSRSQPEARATLTVVFPEPGGPDTITTSPPCSIQRH